MTRLLKSFPEYPLKLLTYGTAADRIASLKLLTWVPLEILTGGPNPLVDIPGHPLLFADLDGWRHGGINE